MSPPWMEAFEPLQPPAPVSWWPPAPGWWLLGALLLTVTIIGAWCWRRHHHRNRYRRTLQHELKALWQRYRPDQHPEAISAYLADCCELVRRTWRLLDGHRAALPSGALLASLQETAGVTIPSTILASIDPLLYGRASSEMSSDALDLPEFHRQVLLWSRRHRGVRGSC